MIEINDDKVIISLNDQDGKEYLTNLSDAIYDCLISQSKSGGEINPDPKGNNTFLLEFLKDASKAKEGTSMAKEAAS